MIGFFVLVSKDLNIITSFFNYQALEIMLKDYIRLGYYFLYNAKVLILLTTTHLNYGINLFHIRFLY